MEKHDRYLEVAIAEAEMGLREGGIPIGSVLVYRDDIIGRGHNKRIQSGSAILHGEMDALQNAGRLPTSIYRKCTLYTTLSPCPMCSGAILLYGIPMVVIGENKNYKGNEELLKSHGVEIIIIQDDRCIKMMSQFIHNNSTLWNEDIGE